MADGKQKKKTKEPIDAPTERTDLIDTKASR